MAISVAGIITTIAVGATNAAKRGARATSKFAKTLGKIAKKAGPVLGPLFELGCGSLEVGSESRRVSFGKSLTFGRHDRVRVVSPSADQRESKQLKV